MADKHSMTVRAGRGVALVYVAAILLAFCAIISLAVDYGHVQMIKTEARRGADAAARAAVAYLGDYITAGTQAIAWGKLNMVDGQPLVLRPDPSDDIEYGTWDDIGRRFSPRTGTDRANSNAVRVNARRTAATGNAVQLTFMGLLGLRQCDVKASSVACIAPLDFVIVGINSVVMAGNSTDGYWPNNPGVMANTGNIASNGDITCKGTSYIHGNAHPGVGHSVIGAANVIGSTTPLTYTLTYPNGSSSPYTAASNDNNRLPKGAYSSSTKAFNSGSKPFTVPAGNYVVKSITIGASSIVTLSGPVTFYCYGTVDVKGSIRTYQNLARNFRLVMIPDPNTGAAPGTVSLKSGGTITGIIYAPQSAITFGSSFDFYGQVVGLTIDMSGGSYIHYDISLAKNGGISTVQ